LWVFTGPRGTVYTIDGRRSHEVVVEVLGPGFSGVWVTDCFRAYDHRGEQSLRGLRPDSRSWKRS
jgi:hypothetical protein